MRRGSLKQGRSLPEWLSLCALTVQQSINWLAVLATGLICFALGDGCEAYTRYMAQHGW